MPSLSQVAGFCRDCLKLFPTAAWLVTSIRAIPSYGALGWTTPVICAVFSSIIAVVATYDIWKYHTPAIHGLYTSILASEEGEGAGEVNKGSIEPSFRLAKAKLIISTVSATVCLAFTIVFMAIAYGTIKPEQDNMPCDGECEDCIEDPDCSNWVAVMESKYPSVNICPPAKKSADTDVTFSCLADAWWMLSTTIITLIWVCAAFSLYRRSKATIGGGVDSLSGDLAL